MTYNVYVVDHGRNVYYDPSGRWGAKNKADAHVFTNRDEAERLINHFNARNQYREAILEINEVRP